MTEEKPNNYLTRLRQRADQCIDAVFAQGLDDGRIVLICVMEGATRVGMNVKNVFLTPAQARRLVDQLEAGLRAPGGGDGFACALDFMHAQPEREWPGKNRA